MSTLAYIPYLSLCFYIIIFFCLIYSVYNWTIMLKFVYDTRKLPEHRRLSRIIVVYVINSFCYNFLVFFNAVYMIVMWRPENEYNSYMIFWTMLPGFVFLSADQVAVLFLTIERCLILKLGAKWSNSLDGLLLKFTIIMMFITSSINIIVSSLGYSDVGSSNNCWSLGCVLTLLSNNVYLFTKFTYAALIMISSIYFGYLLKRYNKTHENLHNSNGSTSQKKIHNSLVIYTISLEFIFNFMPYIATFSISTGIFNATLDGNILQNWIQCGVNLTEASVNSLSGKFLSQEENFETAAAVSQPGVFVGQFSASQLADTFFNSTGLGKGQLFVNGFNLGRYWPSMGPQITLYVPKPIIQPMNTVLLIELVGMNQNSANFVDHPIYSR